jgi:hypothetical protein
MRLEEILAEKVARLTRSAIARDSFDLVWARSNSPHSQFSPEVLRRLAMLKVWVDNHGLGGAWRRALSPRPFNADSWFAPRDPWDDEQIGLLAHPPPSLSDLERDLSTLYRWLGELTEEEVRWAAADPANKGEVIAAIRALDGGALANAHLY